MKLFLNENFLLDTPTAIKLYHDHAKQLPIIDYHNHLPPIQIANNSRFENITQAWLYGDHYKWRAMRSNGVDESYCTGERSDYEKFAKWASTVPYTMRNPLYHWTHLELQRYFNINTILDQHSAQAIYENTSRQLNQESYRVCGLLEKMNVEVLCTTDDPIDSLEYHSAGRRRKDSFSFLPTYRPDRAMAVEDTQNFNTYVLQLEEICNNSISTFTDYLEALKNRHEYFNTNGCFISDHGLEEIYIEEYTEKEINGIFQKVRSNHPLSMEEQRKFKSCMLYNFAVWDFEKGWIQQYHLGAIRNNNSRMLKKIGKDTGWDSIGDFSHAKPLSKFLDKLDQENKLAKTILYNLNPRDNELLASMIGNFNDGSVAGKIQFGSAWWFLDQKIGMINQLNSLSNLGLISRFIGMTTDSRSFLSFPRHEYFRRIVCNLFGGDIENGELPNDLQWVGKIIQDICYNNAKVYFNLKNG